MKWPAVWTLEWGKTDGKKATPSGTLLSSQRNGVIEVMMASFWLARAGGSLARGRMARQQSDRQQKNQRTHAKSNFSWRNKGRSEKQNPRMTAAGTRTCE